MFFFNFYVLLHENFNFFFFQISPLYPSLLAHHASLSHLHPVFILIRLRPDTDPNFVLRNPAIELKSNFSPMHSEMPCDIHILNLRTLASLSGTSYIPSRSSVLNLHRLGFDCNFEMIGNCSFHNGTVSFTLLFILLASVPYMYECFLPSFLPIWI